METIKDEEINKILVRAEDYRKQCKKNFNIENNMNLKIKNDIANIFETFFKNKVKINYNDKSNVFIDCKLNKTEIKKGCTKIVKYKVIDKNNKEIVKKIEIKIPSNINVEQKIVIHGCGNYLKDKNVYSDLIINILKKKL